MNRRTMRLDYSIWLDRLSGASPRSDRLPSPDRFVELDVVAWRRRLAGSTPRVA